MYLKKKKQYESYFIPLVILYNFREKKISFNFEIRKLRTFTVCVFKRYLNM